MVEYIKSDDLPVRVWLGRVARNRVQARNAETMSLIYSTMFSQHPLAPQLVRVLNQVDRNHIYFGFSRVSCPKSYTIWRESVELPSTLLDWMRNFLVLRNTPFRNLKYRVSNIILHADNHRVRVPINEFEPYLLTGYGLAVLKHRYDDSILHYLTQFITTALSRYAVAFPYLTEELQQFYTVDAMFLDANRMLLLHGKTVFPLVPIFHSAENTGIAFVNQIHPIDAVQNSQVAWPSNIGESAIPQSVIERLLDVFKRAPSVFSFDDSYRTIGFKYTTSLLTNNQIQNAITEGAFSPESNVTFNRVESLSYSNAYFRHDTFQQDLSTLEHILQTTQNWYTQDYTGLEEAVQNTLTERVDNGNFFEDFTTYNLPSVLRQPIRLRPQRQRRQPERQETPEEQRRSSGRQTNRSVSLASILNAAQSFQLPEGQTYDTIDISSIASDTLIRLFETLAQQHRNRARNRSEEVHTSSRNREVINPKDYSEYWRNVIVVDSEKASRILQRHPGGGAQTRAQTTDKLLIENLNDTTTRAINNIVTIANSRPQFSPLVLPQGIIQFPLSEVLRNDEYMAYVSSMGAIVKNGNVYEGLFYDIREHIRVLHLLGSNVSYTPSSGTRLHTFETLHNIENWNVINMPGNKKVRDFESGYFVPVEEGKAIYVPSFAVPDMLVGIEYETPLTHSVGSIIRTVKNRFNVDLTYFPVIGQNQLILREPDASLDYGYEYISPALPMFSAIRFNYYMAEALKELGRGAQVAVNRRGDPYGLHVNMSVGNITGRRPVKFAAQYLRLMENVIKRITTPDIRYSYIIPRDYTWHRNRSALGHLSSTRILEQFWSQDISSYKEYSGYNEYDLLRSGRTLTVVLPDDAIAEKISKYHTISFEKLKDYGVTEFRHAIYYPDGVYIANMISVLSKFAGDMFYGIHYYPEYLEGYSLPKLIPNKQYSEEHFKGIIKNIFGIHDEKELELLYHHYTQCKRIGG